MVNKEEALRYYYDNRKWIREFEAAPIFKAYRNLRIFLNKEEKTSLLNTRDLTTLQELKNALTLQLSVLKKQAKLKFLEGKVDKLKKVIENE